MKDSLLPTWYHLLSHVSGRRVQSTRDIARLVEENHEALNRLWSAYNAERADLGRLPLSTKPFVLAYILGFHLNNQHRAQQVLGRAFSRLQGLSDAATRWNLVDLGCGSGALALAMVESLLGQGVSVDRVSLELMDQSRPLLAAARAAAGRIVPEKQVRSLNERLGEIKSRQVFDKVFAGTGKDDGLWVGLSYVLNEMIASPKSMRFLEAVADRLKALERPAVFVLMEAGRESEARLAQEFREGLFQAGFYPLYPCPEFMSCPMLTEQEQSNWCFSEVPDIALPEREPVARALRLHRRKLATAGYVFLNPFLYQQFKGSLQNRSAREIVVGFPEIQKNVRHALVCKKGGLVRVSRFRSDALRGEPL